MRRLVNQLARENDHETGKSFPATIEVNKPLIYKGVAVYQSSFEDGGIYLACGPEKIDKTKLPTALLGAPSA